LPVNCHLPSGNSNLRKTVDGTKNKINGVQKIVTSKTLKEFSFLITVLIIISIKSIIVLLNAFGIDKTYQSNIVVYVICMTTISILPLLSISILFSNRGRAFYLVILDLTISLLFFVDLVYSRAFGHLISFFMIFAKGVTNDLGPSIISMVKAQDFIMLIDLPLLAIIAIKTRSGVNLNRKNHQVIATLALVLYSFVLFGIKYNNVIREREANVLLEPISLSPIGYHMFDFYRASYDRHTQLTPTDVLKVNNWFMINEHYQVPDETFAYLEGILQGKNLIVIQFESLENVVLNESYYGQEITPNINKILKNSIYFPSIYEQVKDGNSADAELLFNTSIFPISVGCTFLRFGENTYNSLPNILEKQNYTSIAIHGDNKEYWNRNIVYPALGFSKYITEEEFIVRDTGGMGMLDSSLFKQSIIELLTINQPYYLYIITLTSHMPFEAARQVGELILTNEDETVDYVQTINYTDKCLGVFYQELKQRGLLENTALIIYGDHEGVHKYYDSKSLPSNDNKIPFIIHVPGMQGLVVDTIGGQIDLMPTLAYLLGISSEEFASTVMGRNLFNSGSGAAAILPNGTIIGHTQDEAHLREAQTIADLIIKSDFFKEYRNGL